MFRLNVKKQNKTNCYLVFILISYLLKVFYLSWINLRNLYVPVLTIYDNYVYYLFSKTIIFLIRDEIFSRNLNTKQYM